MIKVCLFELEKHRNETSFRPYITAQNELQEIGIQLVDRGSYDIALIAQGSIIDKSLDIDHSSDNGAKFCSQFDNGNYIILDGQDSHSLIGIVEVLRKVDRLPMLVLKNSLLKDFDLYKNGYVNGRYYWGPGDYSVPDIDNFKHLFKLSGSNWISTISLDFSGINAFQKSVDVSAMFSRGKVGGTEHGLNHSKFYTAHRDICIDKLSQITGITVDKLETDERIPEQEYIDRMTRCRVILAPFGYGEIAPRDIQSAAMGSVLIKPDMSHIDTVPNIYVPYETYVPCKHDFSDLDRAIETALAPGARQYYTYNMKKYYENMYNNTNLAVYLYTLFKTALSDYIE